MSNSRERRDARQEAREEAANISGLQSEVKTLRAQLQAVYDGATQQVPEPNNFYYMIPIHWSVVTPQGARSGFDVRYAHSPILIQAPAIIQNLRQEWARELESSMGMIGGGLGTTVVPLNLILINAVFHPKGFLNDEVKRQIAREVADEAARAGQARGGEPEAGAGNGPGKE